MRAISLEGIENSSQTVRLDTQHQGIVSLKKIYKLAFDLGFTYITCMPFILPVSRLNPRDRVPLFSFTSSAEHKSSPYMTMKYPKQKQ